MNNDKTTCQCVVTTYGGGWPFYHICNRPVKHTDRVQRRGPDEVPFDAPVCGVHHRNLALGRSVDWFTGEYETGWRRDPQSIWIVLAQDKPS